MKSEFLESELELYVQRLLIHEYYSTGNRYKMLKISPSEERLKAYDAKIVGITPFYCQFKTSNFLTQGKFYKSREDFLKSKGWPISPFYSFELRVPNDPADKNNHVVWQHNILHSLWKANPTGVAYVAPMFHTKTEMELREPFPSFEGCPFRYHFPRSNISVQDVGINSHDRCRLPFFDGLLSIPPHLPVKDLKHRYAFTSHRDITFHSKPTSVEGGNMFRETLKLFITSSIERGVPAGNIDVGGVRAMLGEAGNDNEFLTRFLSFGIFQVGATPRQVGEDVINAFSKLDFLQQHTALAASMHTYFGISTLGLLKVEI